MRTQERLERAGWVAISDDNNTITFERNGQKVLYNWLDDEILLVSGNGPSYIPNEHEVETLCEKIVDTPKNRIIYAHFGFGK